MNLREFFGLVCDRFWEGWDRETRGRLFIGADMLIAMAVHGTIHYLVYTKVDKQPAKVVVSNYLSNLKRVSAVS